MSTSAFHTETVQADHQWCRSRVNQRPHFIPREVYREHGIDGLKKFDWQGPTSELIAHQFFLEEGFRASPPHTAAEASRRIEEATGVKRGLTQVRCFLKKPGVEMALHGGDPVAAQENRGGTRRDSSGVS